MIIKIAPDKNRAKSLLRMSRNRAKAFSYIKNSGYSTIIAENYYEIIKELIFGLLLCKGKKSVGEKAHKNALKEISKEKILTVAEIYLVDDLRIRRNNSYYSGEQIDDFFLKNNSKDLERIIAKLDKELSKILGRP